MSIADIARDSIAYAQPIAAELSEGQMVSTIEVTRRSDEGSVLDHRTGRIVRPTPTLIYRGAASLSATSGPITYGVGEEIEYYVQLTATVPLDAPRIRINDDVRVLRHPDTDLVGREFRVQDVTSGGTVPASRRITMSGAQPAQNQ